MSDNDQQAARPEDLSRLFVERANAGDVDGLVALYEPDAVLAFPPARSPPAATRSVKPTSGCSPTGPRLRQGSPSSRYASASVCSMVAR